MNKLDLENAEEPETKLSISTGSQEKLDNSRKKNICFYYSNYTKAFDCVSQQAVENSYREYQTTLPASWEICMQVNKKQLEPDMEQQTGSKLGKEYIKAVYCHSVYLTYMQSISCIECQAGWSTSWNQDFGEKYE